MAAAPLQAAKWDVLPTLEAAETYTDNLLLAPDSAKRTDWVTQLKPSLAVAAAGPRLRFNATYNPEINLYARTPEENDVFQRGYAAGNMELAEELLFLDFGGSVDQYNTSVQGPISISNINATGNRATVSQLFASPYLQQNFSNEAIGQVRLTGSTVQSDESGLSDSRAQALDVTLKSGPAYKLLAWNLEYSKESIDYSADQDDSDSESFSASMRRMVTPTVALWGQAGYESYRTGDADSTSEGTSWDVGLEWNPAPTTRLIATAGHRFFGKAYSLGFNHRTRLTAWAAGYSEKVTSTRTEFFSAQSASTSGYLDTLFTSQYPDPVARQKAVADFIARASLPPSLSAPVNFFSNQLFLVKRWDGSAGILGFRNVFIANFFRETSERIDGLTQPTSGDLAVSSSISQFGTSALWSLRMTSRDALNLAAAFSRTELPDVARRDDLKVLRFSYTRQLQPKLFASAGIRRQQNDSSDPAFTYTENAAMVSIQQRF